MRRAIGIAIAAALALPAAAAAQDDQCTDAAYCLPAPPASAAQKAKGAKGARKAVGASVVLSRQTGVALVYRPQSLRLSTRSSVALAVYCPTKCTVEASPRLRAGSTNANLVATRLNLRAGQTGTVAVRLTAAQARQLKQAGSGTLSTSMKVTDNYGEHDAAVSQSVRATR